MPAGRHRRRRGTCCGSWIWTPPPPAAQPAGEPRRADRWPRSWAAAATDSRAVCAGPSSSCPAWPGRIRYRPGHFGYAPDHRDQPGVPDLRGSQVIQGRALATHSPILLSHFQGRFGRLQCAERCAGAVKSGRRAAMFNGRNCTRGCCLIDIVGPIHIIENDSRLAKVMGCLRMLELMAMHAQASSFIQTRRLRSGGRPTPGAGPRTGPVRFFPDTLEHSMKKTLYLAIATRLSATAPKPIKSGSNSRAASPPSRASANSPRTCAKPAPGYLDGFGRMCGDAGDGQGRIASDRHQGRRRLQAVGQGQRQRPVGGKPHGDVRKFKHGDESINAWFHMGALRGQSVRGCAAQADAGHRADRAGRRIPGGAEGQPPAQGQARRHGGFRLGKGGLHR